MPRQNTTSQVCRKPLFTIEQANSALPLVTRIVSDISAEYRQLEKLSRLRRRLLKLNRREVIEAFDKLAAQGSKRLNELIDEVNAIGCELKDWETGQVDFHTLRNGREVCLCWRLGEESIRYWHELYAGPTERKAVDQVFSRRLPRRIH